ncbi:hypothetical protein G7Y89_g7916 [Cudoniella acicularis]|uniref:Amino acid permease/ SLC12A domain-containing protein n=1 Tax=Cudoniella acicularis TaxID=354080 RepID=A0A8H4W3C6_9HELO|nr:hypothetical protein G7Y89_g7916 [Cudoniella acicularis]
MSNQAELLPLYANEKGAPEKNNSPSDYEVRSGDVVDCVGNFDEVSTVRQSLNQRHIQMIALTRTIGTSLFLGSGCAIARSGLLGAFLGYTTFNNALYAYSGIKIISIAAAETQNPRRAIPQAVKRVFVRIFLFYVLSIFIVSLVVPSNNPDLLQSTGTASRSLFVIATSLTGIEVVPSIINAIILTSAWSSGNSNILSGSRVLYAIAPRRTKVTASKRGKAANPRKPHLSFAPPPAPPTPTIEDDIFNELPDNLNPTTTRAPTTNKKAIKRWA